MEEWWLHYKGWVDTEEAITIFREFASIQEFSDFLLTFPEWEERHLQEEGYTYKMG